MPRGGVRPGSGRSQGRETANPASPSRIGPRRLAVDQFRAPDCAAPATEPEKTAEERACASRAWRRPKIRSIEQEKESAVTVLSPLPPPPAKAQRPIIGARD